MIDAHVHVWTDDLGRYPRVWPGSEFSPVHFAPEDWARHARPAGVDRAVLVQMSFYGLDHSYLLASMRAWPGMFAGIGVVDDQSDDVEGAMRVLAAQGVRGFRIHPDGAPAAWLDAPGMERMWAYAAQERLALSALVDADALEPLDRMCARHPETPVVIDHLGRIGVDGAVRERDVRALCSLARHGQVRVKVSAFYALGRKRAPYEDLAPFVRQVFDAFGPRRLMWGSDCPFQVQDGHTYAASVALLAERLPFLSSEDKEWMLGRTAEELFF